MFLTGTKEFESKLKHLAEVTGVQYVLLPDLDGIGTGKEWEDSPKWVRSTNSTENSNEEIAASWRRRRHPIL